MERPSLSLASKRLYLSDDSSWTRFKFEFILLPLLFVVIVIVVVVVIVVFSSPLTKAVQV